MERHLKGRRLPALRRTVSDLEALYATEDPFEQLGEFILRDPGVASNLFSNANGVQHQHFGMPVTTVEHAAMMLGLNRVAAIHRQLPVVDPESCTPEQKMLVRVYARAWHASCQAMIWSRMRIDTVPSEVALATLLHDLGEMVLWAFLPDKGAEIEDLVHGQGERSREEAQRHVLGFSCDSLSAALAGEWNLPILVHESLAAESASRPRVRIIKLACRVARLAESGWYSSNMEHTIEEVAGLLHTPSSRMTAVVHRAAVEAARAYRTYAILQPAARLITLPPPLASSPSGSKRPAPAATPESRRRQEPPAPRPEIFWQSLERLEQISDSQPTLPAIVKQTLRGMHEGIGLQRVVYASCTPDGSALKARMVRSSEQSAEFEQFQLELQPPHLFTRLLRQPTSIWVNATNLHRLRHLLPSRLLETLDCDSFFASSVFIDGRPEGLFYGDCHRASELLDEERYQRFQQLCSSAAAAMERLALANVRPA